MSGDAIPAEAERDYVQLLLAWAARRPNETWLHQPVDGRWITYTWAQCAEQVACMASALRATGFPPGSRIGISGRNTAHWYLADLAISMAGYVPVGLYPRQSEKTSRYIFEHAEIRGLFVGPASDVEQLLAAVPAEVPRWSLPYAEVPVLDDSWDRMVAAHPPYTGYVQPPHDQMAMLIYTSGTSGMPKGVVITTGNIVFAAECFRRHVLLPQGFLHGQQRERLLSYLPLAHLFERLAGEGTSLVIGAEVYFLESIEAMGATLSEVAPTFFGGVPLVYSRIQAGVLAKLPQPKLDRLLRIPLLGAYVRRSIRKKIGLQHAKFCVTGSAPIADALVAWFERLGIHVMQGYGLTENYAYTSCNLAPTQRIGSVGKPLPEAEVKLGENDEILTRHAGVMAGYYKDEERTREVFTADGYFRTGDKGHFDQDGFLYIVGRTKDIFKTMKGRYVAPAPIEEKLRTSDIESCCLVGPGVPQPIMLVSLAAGALLQPRETVQRNLLAAMEAVNATLESHEQIAKIVVVAQAWTIDGGLLTPTMKVKRDEVQKRYADLIAREAANRDPFVWEAP